MNIGCSFFRLISIAMSIIFSIIYSFMRFRLIPVSEALINNLVGIFTVKKNNLSMNSPRSA